MSDKGPMKPGLWRERPVAETIALYGDWADSYDADLAGRGYHTPARIAAALKPHLKGRETVLDYGCGTGISGAALADAGIGPLHGTDITREMLEIARGKGIYEKLWLGVAGDAPPGDRYGVIVAVGVVSLGAAPPETLDMLIGALSTGGLLAFSFNDPTLADERYQARLTRHVSSGDVDILFREHGPHLDDMAMGADVIVLRVS